jgi:hypothetical protein
MEDARGNLILGAAFSAIVGQAIGYATKRDFESLERVPKSH